MQGSYQIITLTNPGGLGSWNKYNASLYIFNSLASQIDTGVKEGGTEESFFLSLK